MPDSPNMSATTKELLKKVRMIVPPMLEKFHKGTYLSRPHHSRNASDTGPPGQLGRVAVIGGSERYVNAIGPITIKGSEQLTPEQLHRRPLLFRHGIRAIRYVVPVRASMPLA